MVRNECVKKNGYAVAKFVEALRYKLEGRGFDSLWNFILAALWPRGRISLS